MAGDRHGLAWKLSIHSSIPLLEASFFIETYSNIVNILLKSFHRLKAWKFEPTGGKPNQRFACFYVFHGGKWGGVGWADNVHLHFLTYMMLRYCTSSCTSSHTWCYATVRLLALPHIHDATLLYFLLALPHIHDATLLYVCLHFLTYMMLRYCIFFCTSSHTWCYATVRLLALPHIHDATLLYVFLHFLTYMMLRDCIFFCTSSHTWCYATVRLLALPHIHDATLLYVFLHFLTYMMLRYCIFFCTSSHTWCYATVRFLALPHIHDATLLYFLLHFKRLPKSWMRLSSLDDCPWR